ncbi:MAG: hypothetical protein QM715_13440 [Nibricoccus sp.]
MSTASARFSSVTHSPAAALEKTPSSELIEWFSSLYALSQRSNHVFGSPVGPFYHQNHPLHLPRFVYFGPHTHDESLRLAFLSGFDHTDLRGSFALAQFVEHLVLAPDLGHGLNLSIFPLVDVLGLYLGVNNRKLATKNWSHSSLPEISLLGKDARTRGYHGFVRLETARDIDDITVSLRGTDEAAGVELISSEDFEPLAVRWEADAPGSASADGPLSLMDDLPFPPFELTLRIPASWSADLHRDSVTSILKRFVLRYRGLQAYSQGI